MARRVSTVDVAVAVPARAQVGESPVWDTRTGRLTWVDIPAGLLHSSDVTTGATTSWDVGVLLGAVVPRDGGGWAAVTGEGFALLEGPGHRARTVALVTPERDRRMNDGKCDPGGRFWGGSTDVAFAPGGGGLHRWTGGGQAERVVSGLGLPNGLGWSPDGATMYLADSVARVVLAFDYDGSTGVPTRQRVFADLRSQDGVPDGLAVDEKGHVWVAIWGGGCVLRLSPAGEPVGRLEVPVSQPASCAFGPSDSLFVTTARAGLSDHQLEREPLAGSVLLAEVGVGAPPAATVCGGDGNPERRRMEAP